MAEKKLVPGQTVYLKEGESFDSIELAKREAEMMKELPPTIKLGETETKQLIEESSQDEPIEESIESKEVTNGEEILEKNEPIEEQLEETKTFKLARRLLDKNLTENNEDLPPLVEDETIEKEVEIDYFEDLKEETMVDELLADDEEEEITPKRKAKVIDLENLHVINKTEMDKERDLRNALYGNKAAYQIVAAQSGYMAKILPLVHKDIINILRENVNRFEHQKSLYRVIWEKIHDTSVGKMSFEQWLRSTSVEDIETFYYGLYASTFPNEGSFRYTCPQCGVEHDYKVNHGNLIKTTDKDKMKDLIAKVSKDATTIEKMKEFSLIGKTQAIQLHDSELIVELRTPSLFDLLEILRTVPEKTINRDAESIVYMLYVNRIYIPAKDESGYYEETKKSAILRIIDNLPIDDANEFKDAVDERVDENRITYSLKNIKCVECGTEVKDIPISIENLLFTVIFEKAQ
jgi:hypothetical protein